VKITPTVDHLDRLIEALLVSFNYNELTQLTRIELDENLQWITPVQGHRDLRAVVSELVIY